MIFAGFFIAVSVFFLSVFFAGLSPLTIIDLPSLAIVIAPPLLFTLCSGRTREYIAGWKLVIYNKYSLAEYQMQECREVFRFMYKSTIASGFAGMMLGVIILLGNITDLSSLGTGLSIALLSLLYSVLVGCFLYYPALLRIERMIV